MLIYSNLSFDDYNIIINNIIKYFQINKNNKKLTFIQIIEMYNNEYYSVVQKFISKRVIEILENKK
jgi:hypothetical protein